MKEHDANKSNPMLDEEDGLTVNQVKDGLDKLDQWYPVSTPNLKWFQQQVESEKKRIQTKQWKALITFITMAVCMLSVVIAVVYRQPILFLYFQFVGIALLPLALYKSRKKVSNE